MGLAFRPLVALLVLTLAGCNCGGPTNPDGGFDAGSGGGSGGGSAGGSGGGTADAGPGGGSGGGVGGGTGGGSGGGDPDAGVCVPGVCYPFTAGTAGTGVCRSGFASCIGGVLGPCVGAVGPSTESCNNLDDDCNGTIDDANVLGQVSCSTGACKVTVAACTAGKPTQCTPGTGSVELCDGLDNDCNGAVDEVGCACIHVSPTGLDTNPGTAFLPMRTLNAAIALSASDAGLPKIVCAAAGPLCPSTFDYAEAVAMKNGVSVYGGYQQTASATWPRCASSTTRITGQNAKGVVFDSTVVAATILDGFDVRAGNAATNAAVTIEGSTGAILNANTLTGGAGTVSIGVDVLAGSKPQLRGNTILGGTGTGQAMGVHALNATPVILSSCALLDPRGRCASAGCGLVGASIRARSPASTGGESYGVWLESSPGALIAQSAICGSASTGTSAGVRITGDATGTVLRANSIDAENGGLSTAGVLAESCGSASPWVFDNARIAGQSTDDLTRVDGIRAAGDCHVRVDSNVSVQGGINCARDVDAGVSSRCTVLNNADVIGSVGGTPTSSVGVRCDDGACARIENNRITGRQGLFSAGVLLGVTNTLVARNQISAGCAGTGVGLVSRNAFARIENNVIRGTQCNGLAGPAPLNSYGMQVFLNTGANEVDVNSNTVFGEGAAVSCTSRGIAFDVLAGIIPGRPRGILRNNIVHSGVCPTAFAIHEFNVLADPRVLENNELLSAKDGGVLYRDENQTQLVTAAEVNALLDIGSALNISADPIFDGGFHLGAGSPCINAGTAVGAPVVDIDGDARSMNDIGADEYVP